MTTQEIIILSLLSSFEIKQQPKICLGYYVSPLITTIYKNHRFIGITEQTSCLAPAAGVSDFSKNNRALRIPFFLSLFALENLISQRIKAENTATN